MALSTRQQRRRDLVIVLIVMVLIAGSLLGRDLFMAMLRPTLPGYAPGAPEGAYASLPWDTLKQGQWNLHQPPSVPAAIAQLNGQPVVLKGFMLPFHVPGESNEFWLAAQTIGCYYCSRPGPSEVVYVKVADGKQIMPTDYPVRVFGTLRVAQGEGDEALYTIERAILTLH
jgi:hypothetical protein